MTVRLVDFRRDRHTRNGKDLLRHVCGCIDDVGHRVAGYAIVVWDDAGRSTSAFCEGGPVAMGMIGSYVTDRVNAAVRMVEVE